MLYMYCACENHRLAYERPLRNDKKIVIRGTPLKKIGSPVDIAKTARFLVEGSDFITGALIPVDGGRLIA